MWGMVVCSQYGHVPKTHECWKLSAIELLRQCDNLLENMASNLKPSPIKSMYAYIYLLTYLCISLIIASSGLITFYVSPEKFLCNTFVTNQ